MRVPVYLFTGFKNAGKTTYINNFFNDLEKVKTLIITSEVGENSFDNEQLPENTTVKTIEDHEKFDYFSLSDINDKTKPQQVIVELCGQWPVSIVKENLPDGWYIAKETLIANGTNYPQTDEYKKVYVTDKLTGCDQVIFNRCSDSIDCNKLHKIVRDINRKCEIKYNYMDGKMIKDDIADVLPFDINSDIIELEDKYYAVWQRDFSETPEKYQDKVIKFKGFVNTDFRIEDNDFLIGRIVMTSNIEDMTYKALICKCTKDIKLINNQWITLTARMSKQFHKIYMSEGPVLILEEFETSSPANPEVASYC